MALVLLGVRNDEAEVAVDHPLLGGEVAALDLLRERNLLGGVQEGIAAEIVEEELEGVGRAAGSGGEVELGLVVLDLDVELLELRAKPDEGLLVELELVLQGVDLRHADVAALLRVVDKGGDGRGGIEGFSAHGKFSQHSCLRVSLGAARARFSAAGAPIYRV